MENQNLSEHIGWPCLSDYCARAAARPMRRQRGGKTGLDAGGRNKGPRDQNQKSPKIASYFSPFGQPIYAAARRKMKTRTDLKSFRICHINIDYLKIGFLVMDFLE